MRLIISSFVGGMVILTSPAMAQTSLAKAENLKLFVEQIVGPMQYPRNYKYPQELNRTAAWLTEQMRLFSIPCYYQNFNLNQQQYRNVVCRLNAGRSDQVVIGAHYDVENDETGVNHNASGVAGVLETAHIMSQNKNRLKHNIEFVFYTLGAQPYANSEQTGSIRHAKSLKNAEQLTKAVYILDQIGFYNKDNVQEYPTALKWIYPSHANFIAVISNINARELGTDYCQNMRKINQLQCERFSLPFNIFEESDHLSYAKHDFPAILITDTGHFRDQNRFNAKVEMQRLDYTKMAFVIDGLIQSLIQVR
jgi:hypothetical protein